MKLGRIVSLGFVLFCCFVVPVWSETPGDSTKPSIGVEPAKVTGQAVAGTSAKAGSFTIRNDGAGSFSYQITSNMSWLGFSPKNGTVSSNSQEIEISCDATKMNPGSYVAQVTITAPDAQNNPQIIPVLLTVLPKAVIALNTQQLSAKAKEGKSPSAQTIGIQNQGSGKMSYSVRVAYGMEGSGWLSLTPTQGEIGTGEGGSISVNFNSSKLKSGNYLATVEITDPGASNSPQKVQVLLTMMTDQSLSLGTTELSVKCGKGKKSEPQAIRIENTSSEAVVYESKSKDSWITLMPASRELAPGEQGVLSVICDAASLKQGTYPSEVQINAKGSSSIETVKINLTVTTPPVIAIDAEKLDFKAKAGTDLEGSGYFVIKNDGDGTLHFQCLKDASWLELDPVSGKLEKGESKQIHVKVRTAGLKPGEHPALIQVTDPNAENSPQKLPVNLIVEAVPEVDVTPTEIVQEVEAGTGAKNESLRVKNIGPAEIKLKIFAEPEWVGAFPKELTLKPGAEGQVTVTPNIVRLSGGEHVGAVRIESDEEKEPAVISVSIKINVKGGADLAVEPSELSAETKRGTDAPAGSFEVMNRGTAPFVFAIKAKEDWIKVEPAQGTIPTGEKAAFEVTYKTKDLGVGDYKTNIGISDPKVKISQKIPVKLTVTGGKKNSSGGPQSYMAADGKTVWEQSTGEGGMETIQGVPAAIQQFVVSVGGNLQDRGIRTEFYRDARYNSEYIQLSYSDELSHEEPVKKSDGSTQLLKYVLWDLSVHIYFFPPYGTKAGLARYRYLDDSQHPRKRPGRNDRRRARLRRERHSSLSFAVQGGRRWQGRGAVEFVCH